MMQNSGLKRLVGSDHQQAQNANSGPQRWTHLQHAEHETYIERCAYGLNTSTHCHDP